MAFVDEDDVEDLRRDSLVVSDGKRLAERGQILDELRLSFTGGVELWLTVEHRVETLDGRDYDLGRGADRVSLEMLDLVELSELAMVIGGAVALEFLLRLIAEIGSIDEEKY